MEIEEKTVGSWKFILGGVRGAYYTPSSSQLTFTCSKSTIKALEKDMKYIQR